MGGIAGVGEPGIAWPLEFRLVRRFAVHLP